MSDRDLLGPCGDYCGGCAEYIGLITDTARQLKEFLDTYAYEYRSQGALARQLKEFLDTYAYEYRSQGAFDFAEFARALQWVIDNGGCPGCQQGGGPPSCQVRACCAEKGLSVCFECESFPCSKLEEVSDPDTMERYGRFKELGLDAWLREQARKAREGYEIHLRRVPTLTRRAADQESV